MKRITTFILFMLSLLSFISFTACDDNSSDKKKVDLNTYIVSGTLALPGTDTLTDGSYKIFINGEDKSADDNSWDSGNTAEYSIEIASGTYNDIDIMAYNDTKDLLYSYHTTTAGLVVSGADVTGFDFNLAETVAYAVSGTLTLPGSDTLSLGGYEITFEGSVLGETEGIWSSGNTQTYSAELEPGTYNSVQIEVVDNYNNVKYRYTTDSLDLTIDDADVSNVDFTLDEVQLYTVSGTITLPDDETLTNGSYSMEFDGTPYGYTEDTWGSGHTLNYSIELEPGTYNDIEIDISDDTYETVYIYRTHSLGLTITNADVSDVNFTVDDYITYTVSGTITLPGSDTLTGGFYQIYFDGDGIASEWEDGDWVSGNTQTYTIVLEPGTYTEVEIEVYENDSFSNLLYEYYTSTASVVVSDSDISGVDFTVE